MHHTGLVIAVTIGLLVMALPKSPNAFGAPSQAVRAGAQKSMITIPQSLQTEHEEIHKALDGSDAGSRASRRCREGTRGGARPALRAREPDRLAAAGPSRAVGGRQTPAGLQEALAMTDALRKELPRMLEEHKRIRAATEKLRIAAREEKASVHEQFAETLAAHAQTEEEILYPAAILVGDIIRARIAKK